MKISRTEQAFECLQKNEGQEFTPHEIGLWIFENYRDECLEKLKNSPVLNNEAQLITQLAAEIKPDRLKSKSDIIKIQEGPPRKYSYGVPSSFFRRSKEREQVKPVLVQNQVIENKAPDSKEQKSLTEHELYPMLSSYLLSQVPKVYTKRIDERQSSNSTRGTGGNHWLYPDLVGVEILGESWSEEIQKCVKVYSDRKTKLWSFEVKLEINSSKVREYFFQAVSNSSWANFSYLVASKISGRKTMDELRILASLHGIGFILLNVDDISKSQILISAKERDEVDWNTADRIVEENKQFKKYIQHIRQFYQTGDWKEADWDGKPLD